ncbi:MAG: hypothetical protein MZW92_43810 [Comamonadaceae bacterium]|nr:hypothetical protein [Comamonadaceae bacterium]
MVGLVGGAYGEALAGMPEPLAVQEGLARLVQCVGPLHPRRLVRGAFTNWAADPLHRGGYAYLKPGGGACATMAGQAGSRAPLLRRRSRRAGPRPDLRRRLPVGATGRAADSSAAPKRVQRPFNYPRRPTP